MPGEESIYRKNIWKLILGRIGWLILFLGGLLVCTMVMQTFESLLRDELELAFFVPLLIGHAGNSGGQTITTIIRELGCKTLALSDARYIMYKESVIGIVQSIFLSIVLFPYMVFTHIPPHIILIVSLTMITLGLFANLCGALLPFLIMRIHLDPAIVVAPLMTTAIDTVGLLMYLSIAMAIINY